MQRFPLPHSEELRFAIFRLQGFFKCRPGRQVSADVGGPGVSYLPCYFVAQETFSLHASSIRLSRCAGYFLSCDKAILQGISGVIGYLDGIFINYQKHLYCPCICDPFLWFLNTSGNHPNQLKGRYFRVVFLKTFSSFILSLVWQTSTKSSF